MRDSLKPFLRPLLGLLFLSTPLLAQMQIPNYGIIANVRGDVIVEPPTGAPVQAVNGMRVFQNTVISTDTRTDDGTALLLFPNGASMMIEPETTFKVETFEMRPDPNRRPDSPFLEPGQSATVFDLERGRIVGNINRLNPQSRLDVNTPVGYARVLGTQFVIEVTQIDASSLQIAYYLSRGQIRVDTIPNPAAGIQGGQVVLNPGEKLVVRAQYDAQGNVNIVSEPEQGVLTPEEVTFVEQLIEETPEAPVMEDVDTAIDDPTVPVNPEVDVTPEPAPGEPTPVDDTPPIAPEVPVDDEVAGPQRPPTPVSGTGDTGLPGPSGD